MVIYCSKALQAALKLTKSDMVKPESLQQNDFYSWHGHIAKADGRNVIVLMNDKTMYCMLFRNKFSNYLQNHFFIYFDNIIYLPREPLGRYVSRRTQERRLVLMVTYDELFNFVIMLCAVITLVIYCTRKK